MVLTAQLFSAFVHLHYAKQFNLQYNEHTVWAAMRTHGTVCNYVLMSMPNPYHPKLQKLWAMYVIGNECTSSDTIYVFSLF